MFWEPLRARFTREALTRSFVALRIRDYRRWSIAQLLSGAGAAASQIAIAWLVIELGGDGIALGAVTACMMLPTLLLGPFIGILVDRHTRRAVLLVTAVAQMLIAGVLAALTFGGALELWMLMALSLAHGVAFAADNPARQLLVMDIVGRERMTSAVSMNEVIINGARVIGPAIAGVLLVVSDAGWCFVVNVLMFVPSIFVLLSLRPVAPAGRTEPADSTAAAARPIGAWRFAMHTPAIRATLLLAVCASACYNIAVVVPLIVADVFHADGGTYGALAVAFGLGALPGAFFSATGPTMPRSAEVRAMAVAMAAAVLLSAGAPTLPLLFVGLAAVGMVVMWFIARANAFVMLSTPTAIRGRVMGIWAMALPGSTVVTGLLIGGLADLTDPRIAYGAVGLVTALVVTLSWRGLRSAR
ncbi:MFS transporter [Microbacterium saperdae]|uniref:Transmembrane secretion effector n=1 Tax=Microbacterium saperdae TaxID=69368 RepID=A0A543BK73_9MICO|nr:transmembrane secretion effector [Microbacterium saperdae]GGM55819.1 MFS transporter [Microbacterium saperdae]